jgi:hypothetical protein
MATLVAIVQARASCQDVSREAGLAGGSFFFTAFQPDVNAWRTIIVVNKPVPAATAFQAFSRVARFDRFRYDPIEAIRVSILSLNFLPVVYRTDLMMYTGFTGGMIQKQTEFGRNDSGNSGRMTG